MHMPYQGSLGLYMMQRMYGHLWSFHIGLLELKNAFIF